MLYSVHILYLWIHWIHCAHCAHTHTQFGQSREVLWQLNGFSVNKILMNCSIQPRVCYRYVYNEHTHHHPCSFVHCSFCVFFSAHTHAHTHRVRKYINKSEVGLGLFFSCHLISTVNLYAWKRFAEFLFVARAAFFSVLTFFHVDKFFLFSSSKFNSWKSTNEIWCALCYCFRCPFVCFAFTSLHTLHVLSFFSILPIAPILSVCIVST